MSNTTKATTRATMNGDNKKVYEARATLANSINSKQHLLEAYRTLVLVQAAPYGTPADVKDAEPVKFEPVNVHKLMPIKYLVAARGSLRESINELERALTADKASKTSIKKAFADFIHKHNGGEPLRYSDIAAKWLLMSCARMRTARDAGADAHTSVKINLDSVLPHALHLACTGLKPAPESDASATDASESK